MDASLVSTAAGLLGLLEAEKQFRRVYGFREWRSYAARWAAKPLEVHPLATSPNAAQDCPKYYGLQDILLGREAETLKLTLCIGRYLTA